jgi:hypothetical protein
VTDGDPARTLCHSSAVWLTRLLRADRFRSLKSGEVTTMVDLDGSTLARPVRLNVFAFRAVYAGD